MAMASSLYNQKKNAILLLHSTLRNFKPIFTPMLIAPPAHQLHFNGHTASVGELRTLCKEGRLKEALQFLRLMDRQGFSQNSSTYSSILQCCVNRKALAEGKLVHAHMLQTGFEPEVYLGTKLVIMYAKCASLVDGNRALEEMTERNVVSWTAMIAAYSTNGSGEEALGTFCDMRRSGIQPDQFTFASVLQACKGVECGMQVHGGIIRSGFRCDVFVGNALLDMYAKCGSLEDSRQVFDNMRERDVVSWTAMVGACVRHGHVQEALRLFYGMQGTGVQPNEFTFASVLPAFGALGELEGGKEIHKEIVRSGFQSNVILGNALVDMYVKCGSLEDAHDVFENLPQRNVVSWNVMVGAYAQNGHVVEALELFRRMPERNVVSWTAMIVAYAKDGCCQEALKVFYEMILTGVRPDQFTFSSALLACACLETMEYGKEIHENIIRNGFQYDIFVNNALIDMYGKCGRIVDAQRVFENMLERDLVSWNAMITGYAQNGQVDEALQLFGDMPEKDVVSWNVMISAYAQNGYADEAWNLFEKMPERNAVSWTAMLAQCAQDGQFVEATSLFQEMPERDVVSWNAMIAGYIQNGNFHEALHLFGQMQITNMKPNTVTYLGVISACANMAAMEYGKKVHEDIIRKGFESDTTLGNSLIDMYAKCSSIKTARKVFDKMPERVVVSWNTMIGGYGMHGCGDEALQLFEQMQHSGLKPNHVTFLVVLFACSHAGLLDDGRRYFDLMSRHYEINPLIEHYCCMVDLLGRAGFLDEAEGFISKMPLKPNAAVWRSLLGACAVHYNIDLGERVADLLFESDPNNSAHYVLLSNMYALAGRWNDVGKVRALMKDRSIKKVPGCSWIEVRDEIHAFTVRDGTQP